MFCTLHFPCPVVSFFYPPRPVVAVFDIELLSVSQEMREQVRRDVTAQLGPADPTILVSSRNGAEIDVPKLLRAVMEYGGIVLMR